MTVHLHRTNRLVVVTGPSRGPADPAVVELIRDRLTYHTRTYSHESGSYEAAEHRMFEVERDTHNLAFPLGLLSSVVRGLESSGASHVVHGSMFADLDPTANRIDTDAVLAHFSLVDGQDECLARIAACDGGVITASVGFGKTVVIVMTCLMYPSATIHVVSRSADVARTLFERLSAVLPSVGMIGGGSRTRGRVTVFVADSLHHGEGNATIVLADECHELVTSKYVRSLGMYRTARMFGFTATPTGRHDGRDPELEAIFGPILFSLSYQDAQAAGRVVPLTVEWLRIESGPSVGGLDPTTRDRIGVWRNDERNEIFAHRTAIIPSDEQTLVITATIDHAVRLKKMLPDFTLCYAPQGMDVERLADYQSQGLLEPDEPLMTKNRRELIRKEFAANRLKKVISNYVWSTGVDFPYLEWLVRADAGGKGKAIKAFQIPGRASRRVAGVKESATVIDGWDAWDESMLDRSRFRRRTYQEHGWSQVFGQTVEPRSPI